MRKMNLVIILFSVCVVRIICHNFFENQTVDCRLKLPNNVISHNHTIIYYEEEKHNAIIGATISQLTPEHSFTIIRGANKVIHFKILLTKTGVHNLILVITNLNLTDLYTSHFDLLLNSFWCPVHLIWAGEDKICTNGTFDSKQLVRLNHYLNLIWHLHRIARVIVLFPYECENHYVIYGEKEMSDTTIYKRSIKIIETKDINEITHLFFETGTPRYLTEGYPLKANIFIRFPTSVPNCETVSKYTNQDFSYKNEKYYCGLDGMVLYDFITHYKYNLSKTDDESCGKYGIYVEEDNITTGALDCVVNKKIDISFNSRFMVYYGVDNYTYIHYVAIDSLCAIMKRRSTIPLWHYVHSVFTPLIWAVLLTAVVLIGLITWISARISSELFGSKPFKFYCYIINSVTGSFFGFLLHNDKNFLLIKSTSLVCSILILAIFQGHVNYMFTTKAWYPRLKTFEDLRNSPLQLHISSSIYSLLIHYVLHNLAYKLVLRDNITIDDVLVESLVGTVDRKEDLIVQVLYNYTDENGVPLLDIVDECFYTNYLAYIANIDFIFIDETHAFILRLLEAGLPNIYYVWTRRQFLEADKFLIRDSIPRPYKPFKLASMRTVFGILITGYLISIATFVVEIWKGRRNIDKNQIE